MLVLLVDAEAVDGLVILVKDFVFVDNWRRMGCIGGIKVGQAGVMVEVGSVGVVRSP